jgi:uncharacterized protein (TIGR00730 family)
MNNICVFASGSKTLDDIYLSEAQMLGRLIAQRGFGLVFGGGKDGLMGAVARGADEEGGRIIGVVPEMMNVKGIIYDSCTELFVTSGIRERKALMEREADAFIALPGGFGTLEELLEIITLRQLGCHRKPIAAVNTNGFYSHLKAQFDETVRQGFASEDASAVYKICDSAKQALDYIASEDAVRPYIKNDLIKRP